MSGFFDDEFDLMDSFDDYAEGAPEGIPEDCATAVNAANKGE